jgi:Arylsulfotransferase (ASST)
MRFRRDAARARLAVATSVAVALGLLVTVLATASFAAGTVQITATPGLYPAFNPAVSDYVVRCTAATPVRVTVSASDTTTTFSVDGEPASNHSTTSVSLKLGQAFTVAVTPQGGAAQSYYVRCLPSGFPTWSSQRPGSPQAAFYLVAPSFSTGFGQASRYIAIFDTNGVPIWWTQPPSPYKPVDAKLLPNGDVLWTEMTGSDPDLGYTAEEHKLDGTPVDPKISPTAGYQSNTHEVQLLPDGDYLVTGTYARSGFNLTSLGGPASASIRDDVIQEVTPGGSAVWTWDAADHVGLDEVDPQWRPTIVRGPSPYDVFHMNSAVTDASGNLLVSLRYTDAVFKVTNPAATTNAGKIIWKLGGSAPTKEPGTRLTIVGDPVFAAGGGFGGQHYPRFFDAGDGNLYVTLHDNGTGRGRAPRAVRYQIDEAAKTATLEEQVTDTAAPNLRSSCCGSAERLSGGDWVMSWGGNPIVTELTPSGTRAFVLTFSGAFSYRADPILPGVLTRDALRSAMNTQYPR